MKQNIIEPAVVERAAKVIHVLNHKERIYILNLLAESIRLRPVDIAQTLAIRYNIVMKHLDLLMKAGLLKRRAETRKVVYYSLNKDRISQLRTGVKILSIRNGSEYADYVRFGTVA